MEAFEAREISKRARIEKVDHLAERINSAALNGEDHVYSRLTRLEVSILEEDLGYNVKDEGDYFKISWRE